MATTTVTATHHGTTTAATVDIVNISSAVGVIIRNRDTGIAIYYTYAVGGATAATPAAADESYILPAGASIFIDPDNGNVTQVKVFPASGTPAYSVEGF